jgi:hypothetical protein
MPVGKMGKNDELIKVINRMNMIQIIDSVFLRTIDLQKFCRLSYALIVHFEGHLCLMLKGK